MWSKHKLLVWMVHVARSGAASADVWYNRIIVLLTIRLLYSCDFVEAHCYLVTISKLISMSIYVRSRINQYELDVVATSSNQLLLIDSATLLNSWKLLLVDNCMLKSSLICTFVPNSLSSITLYWIPLYWHHIDSVRVPTCTMFLRVTTLSRSEACLVLNWVSVRMGQPSPAFLHNLCQLLECWIWWSM